MPREWWHTHRARTETTSKSPVALIIRRSGTQIKEENVENFIIDPEFRDKIPPLSADEFQRLEENIVADGEVREPLVIWGNTIIDGHNRWKIIQKHPEILYKVKHLDFPDKWAAVVWMCKNQLGRRNLTGEQKSYLIGKEYEAQKKTHGGCRVSTTESVVETKDSKKGHIGIAAKAIMNRHGVGYGTVIDAEKYAGGIDAAEKASPGIKNAVLSGEVKAPKCLIAEILNTQEEKRPAAVEAIKSGDIGKAKEIIMDNPKKEIKDDTLKKVIADLYDTEKVVEHTVDDLLEDLDAMISNFASMMRRSISMKADWCKTDEEKKRVRAKLSEVDTVMEELRGKMA
jgi:hypothetical protein